MKSVDDIVSALPSRQRDPQQYRVYQAEENARTLYGFEKLNPITIKMLAQDIRRNPVLCELYPRAMTDPFPIVLKGNKKLSAYAFMGTIYLPKWAQMDWIVCHEISHLIDRRENGITEAHGPVFCNIMLSLVSEMISQEAGEILRNCYDEQAVKI